MFITPPGLYSFSYFSFIHVIVSDEQIRLRFFENTSGEESAEEDADNLFNHVACNPSVYLVRFVFFRNKNYLLHQS